MEHNAIQWLGAPSCQRGSFSFYKSVGSRTRPDGPVRTWRLGEFYFIRCGPQEPVCLAEVTLLWEDQTQRHPLASARLYFLPEDTPKGRTRDHGEDEVLAVSRKMVVKVEDLVRWSCSEEDGWKVPGVPGLNGINGVHKELRIQGPIQELRIQGPIQEPQTEDLHTEDLQNKDSTQDPTQDLQTKDSTQNPQTQDPIQDPQTKGPIQDPQTKGPIQGLQTKGPIQDPQTKGPIQGLQTKGPIQDPENKDPIQDPSQDPQTEDPIQDPSQNPENKDPIQDPSQDPQTEDPIQDPSQDPENKDPVQDPSPDPQTKDPIQDPSQDPENKDPVQDPSQDPQTKDPILEPAQDSAQEQQTQDQTQNPTQDPTSQGQTQNQTQERTENQSLDQEVKEEKVELKIAEEEGLKVKEEVEEGLKVKEEVELKVEETALKVEEKAGLKPEEAGLKQEGSSLKKEKLDASAPQWVKVLSYPQYCRFRSLQRRTQGGAAGLQLQDPFLLALGGLKVALSNTRVMYCRDTFNHPTLENNASFSWQFTGCPSLSLRGRPRKRKARDGKDSPTSSQSESWIDRMQENVMGSVESGCEGAWLPHPDEQFFLDQLFAFMDKQGAPIYKVPNLGFKKIDLFRMYSVVKRLGGYEKVTNDRLWKIVYNELGGCPGSTSAATCTRRHYERLMLPYEEHLRAGGIEIRIPEFPLPVRAKGMRGRKPGRKPGPKPKDKKPSAPSGPRTVVNPDGTVVVKRGRGRPPGKKNKSTLLAQAKLLAQQQAKGRVVTAGTGLGIRAGPGIRTGPGGAGRGRPPAHPSLHRVPPLHAPQPIAPAIISVNMPLTPDLSPRSAPFLTFQAKPQDLNRPESSSTNNTSSTTTTTTTAVPPQGLLLSALPHHFVSGFSPIKGLCHLDVFRNRIQRSENAASNAQDASQHLQPQQHQIVYSIQPKIAENSQGLSQNQDANRNRLPLPPLRVLPLDLDCSVQVRQLMRTRLGSTQFQTFTRRLSEALSHDVASKPVPCSPITPPPEQNLPLNLSKRLPQKRAHADGAEASAQDGEAKRQRQQQQEDFGSRLGQVGGQELRAQEEPADLSSPSRIRAFLLGLPPFQVKLEEDLNGARFPKLSQESRRLEVENLGMKRQDDDVIIVEDDRDDDDEDDEEQEAVVFVKEEFNGKEVKADKIAEENIEVLKQPPTLVLAQQS